MTKAWATGFEYPLYNDGSMMRHGVSLGWRGNQMIPNLNGPEFVIYESGEGVKESVNHVVPSSYVQGPQRRHPKVDSMVSQRN